MTRREGNELSGSPDDRASLPTKVAAVIDLLRRDVPGDEFDTDDWDALRVAARLVFETERLGSDVGHGAIAERDDRLTDWSDSIEGALSFMVWVRDLASIARDARFPSTTPCEFDALWRRHNELSQALLLPELGAVQRILTLVELGGIEVTLLGRTWALEPAAAEAPK